MAEADTVLAVGDSSSLGAARLVDAWSAVGRATTAPQLVVRNRCQSRSVPTRQWQEAIRHGGVTAAVHEVPFDPDAVAACWRRGASLGEAARRSALRRSLSGLAEQLVSG